MRKRIPGFIAPLLLVPLVSLGAFAESAGAAEKIGFVDLRKAVFSSEEGREAQRQFSKLEEQKLDTLRPRREELQKLEEEYESQKYVLSAEALQERRLEIMKRRRDLERDLREAEDDLQIRQVQLLQPIQKKIAAVVGQVGKENGFTMIVDKSTNGLVYFEESLDVTDLVIQKLNEN
jgi:outer membrane protein